MKSRGSSFTAFEDEVDPDVTDAGHLKMDSAPEHAMEARRKPADLDPFAESSTSLVPQAATMAVSAPKHRRTTR